MVVSLLCLQLQTCCTYKHPGLKESNVQKKAWWTHSILGPWITLAIYSANILFRQNSITIYLTESVQTLSFTCSLIGNTTDICTTYMPFIFSSTSTVQLLIHRCQIYHTLSRRNQINNAALWWLNTHISGIRALFGKKKFVVWTAKVIKYLPQELRWMNNCHHYFNRERNNMFH